MAMGLLPDALWEEIRPLLPPPPPPSSKGGRPPADDRSALRGILYVDRYGIPWQALPTKAFGVSGQPPAGVGCGTGPGRASGPPCTGGCSTAWARRAASTSTASWPTASPSAR